MKKICDWMKKVWAWIWASHRMQHLLLAAVAGLGCESWYMTECMGAGLGGTLEFKDYKYGQVWDWIDLLFTVAGTNLGYLVRTEVMARLIGLL